MSIFNVESNINTNNATKSNQSDINYVKSAFGGSATLPRFDSPSLSVREFLKSVTSPDNAKIPIGNGNSNNVSGSIITCSGTTDCVVSGEKASGSFRSRGTASPY